MHSDDKKETVRNTLSILSSKCRSTSIQSKYTLMKVNKNEEKDSSIEVEFDLGHKKIFVFSK